MDFSKYNDFLARMNYLSKILNMDKKPILTRINLSKEYAFMYENFIISTQTELYLLLENDEGNIRALKFKTILFKYGYPNDEGLGVHPMAKYGLSFYGFFHVEHSEWIEKLMERRPKTSWKFFETHQHYIATFKDVCIDIICRGFEEVTLTKDDIIALTLKQLDNLKVDE